MRRLILASSSPYRQLQLKQLGLIFEAHPSGIDEEPYKELELAPPDIATELARQKAISLGPRFPDALIIAGDQIAEVDGEMLNKPGNAIGAQLQLRALADRSHRLWTALAVHEPASMRTEVALEHHTLKMRPLTDRQIANYVQSDQPFDCVGSYRIEALGISLFASIKGNDFSAIMGLPLIRLVSILELFGVYLPPR